MHGCAAELTQYLREHTGLYLSEGKQYGENGSSFIRMNIACSRSRLEDGLERLAEGVRGYEEWPLDWQIKLTELRGTAAFPGATVLCGLHPSSSCRKR